MSLSVHFKVRWIPVPGNQLKRLNVYVSLPRAWRAARAEDGSVRYNSHNCELVLRPDGRTHTVVLEGRKHEHAKHAVWRVNFMSMEPGRSEEGHAVLLQGGQASLDLTRMRAAGETTRVTLTDARTDAADTGELKISEFAMDAAGDDAPPEYKEGEAPPSYDEAVAASREFAKASRRAPEYEGSTRYVELLQANEYDTGLRINGQQLVLPFVGFWEFSGIEPQEQYFVHLLSLTANRMRMTIDVVVSDCETIFTELHDSPLLEMRRLRMMQLYVRYLCAYTTAHPYVSDYTRRASRISERVDADFYNDERICRCKDCEDGTKEVLAMEYALLSTRWTHEGVRAMQRMAQQFVALGALSLVTNPSMAAAARDGSGAAGRPEGYPVAGHMFAMVQSCVLVAHQCTDKSLTAKAMCNFARPDGVDEVEPAAWVTLQTPPLVAESTAMTSPLPSLPSLYVHDPKVAEHMDRTARKRAAAMRRLFELQPMLQFLAYNVEPSEKPPDEAFNTKRWAETDDARYNSQRLSSFYRRIKTFSSMRTGVLAVVAESSHKIGVSFESLVVDPLHVQLIPLHDMEIQEWRRKLRACSFELHAEKTLTAPTRASYLAPQVREALEQMHAHAKGKAAVAAAAEKATSVSLYSPYDYFEHNLVDILHELVHESDHIVGFEHTEEPITDDTGLVRLQFKINV